NAPVYRANDCNRSLPGASPRSGGDKGMEKRLPGERVVDGRPIINVNPDWNWQRHLPSLGHSSVDFERRVDFDRLRGYRLERARQALKNSKCGALLLFDVNNIRYVSGTKIGEWERDKLCRFALLAGDN